MNVVIVKSILCLIHNMYKDYLYRIDLFLIDVYDYCLYFCLSRFLHCAKLHEFFFIHVISQLVSLFSIFNEFHSVLSCFRIHLS